MDTVSTIEGKPKPVGPPGERVVTYSATNGLSNAHRVLLSFVHPVGTPPRPHFFGVGACCCSCSSCFSFISIIIFSCSLVNLGNSN
jgi:hypothetical protein